MATSYETDIAAWAREQAELLRSGRLSAIDALNIAEEIEDVGKSAKRELGSHIAVLLAHLLKWKFQPQRRSRSWEATIRLQRAEIRNDFLEAPSLVHALDNAEWLALLWRRGAVLAHKETALEFPQQWLWSVDQVIDDAFWPD
jgi:hypothetical protein